VQLKESKSVRHGVKPLVEHMTVRLNMQGLTITVLVVMWRPLWQEDYSAFVLSSIVTV